MCTVPGLRLGTHPWMPPQQVPEESWQQAPHPPCIPASATSSAGGVIGLSSPRTLPIGTAQARGQSTEFSPHSVQDTPRLGVFL